MKSILQTILLLMVLLFFNISLGQKKKDFLRLVTNNHDDAGYVNAKGDTIISPNKYRMCFTEKFYNFAIVLSKDKGFIGIDRDENVLFNVFIFDNGPDYLSDGLYRIIKNGKIGFADKHGKIIIEPQYDGAFPFKKGKATVCTDCIKETDGEHSWWAGGTWLTINKKGKTVNEEKTK